MSFGKKIKDLRSRFNLKQLDLANSLNVSAQAVSKWERDENYPDILTLKKMSRLFEVSVDDLLEMYDRETDVFEATILCSGINRFADRARTMSPRDLAGLMNTMFIQMTEAVLKQGGVPVKYTGDGFLCFFSGVGNADRAIDAAVRIIKIHQDKDIVVFLHYGKIFLGKVGHPNYASKDIYGDTVNRAFLMMAAFSARVKSGIACSQNVKDALKTKSMVFKKMGGLKVPSLKEICDLYALRS